MRIKSQKKSNVLLSLDEISINQPGRKTYEKNITKVMYVKFYTQKEGTLANFLPGWARKLWSLSKVSLGLYDSKSILIMPYLELCITPRCTLKCAKCANLMQYYHKPKDYDVERIIASIDRLLASVDFIDSFRILGGEPFLHKDIAQIICHCLTKKKIGQVQIVTNGTIVPKEEVLSALTHKNLSVYISDYGAVSSKKSQLEKCLSQRGVKFVVDSNYAWDDMGGLEHRDYGEEVVRAVYRNCGDICKTLVDGIVYVCPRSAHGDKLGLFPKNDQDYVDIYAGTIDDVRKKLRELYSVEYLEACHYCNPVKDRDKITAGEQGFVPRVEVNGNTDGK